MAAGDGITDLSPQAITVIKYSIINLLCSPSEDYLILQDYCNVCVRLRPWCKGQWKFDRMLMAVYFLVQDVDFYYTPLLLCFLKSTFTAFENFI